MATESGKAKASVNQQPVSPWAAALNQLKEWDPAWAEHTLKMTTNPQMDGMLPIRFIELVSVGLNASRTNLNPGGHTPPHSSCARRGCEPSRDLIRSQVCVCNVRSFH